MLERIVQLFLTESLPAGLVLLGTGLILYWLLERVG